MLKKIQITAICFTTIHYTLVMNVSFLRHTRHNYTRLHNFLIITIYNYVS